MIKSVITGFLSKDPEISNNSVKTTIAENNGDDTTFINVVLKQDYLHANNISDNMECGLYGRKGSKAVVMGRLVISHDKKTGKPYHTIFADNLHIIEYKSKNN